MLCLISNGGIDDASTYFSCLARRKDIICGCRRERSGMRRFDHHAVGVCQGSALLFSAFEDQGEMWSGHGHRLVRHAVTFEEAFAGPPVVHVSIAMWDIDGQANQRADICAEAVSRTGFDILFQTWGDTRVARIRAEWLAIGPVAHLDDFSL